jgi:hypothetical protein
MVDIKLENDNVIVEGTILKAKVEDLEIDAPLASGRRIYPYLVGGRRRALVHGYGDILTMNWERDYPGGVKIEGDVHIPDNLDVRNITAKGYSNGITIWGKVKIQDTLEANKIEIPDIVDAKRIEAKEIKIDELYLRDKVGRLYSEGVYFTGGWRKPYSLCLSHDPPLLHKALTIKGGSIEVNLLRFCNNSPEILESKTYDLLGEILELRDEVDTLKKEIEKLKA